MTNLAPKAPDMAVDRTKIERALEDLISNEEGMRFQGLSEVAQKLQVQHGEQ
jgi:hypothetical protein